MPLIKLHLSRLVLVFTFTFIFCAAPSFAEERHHHEELTSAQLGAVHFPVSCVASVREPFERGVALLHSFWYEQAETTFKKIVQDDPHCSMAHWGIAMSLWHQLWNHPDEATVERGKEEIAVAKAFHSGSEREAAYIAALSDFYSGPKTRKYRIRAAAYSKAMHKVYEHNSEDNDAAAFYALSLLPSEPEHDPDQRNRKKAAAILEAVFAQEPDHPGIAHYLIHTYDTEGMAELGLPAARRYAHIAPAAPHALHMPAHIFARLGLWQDDIDSNLASIAASHKYAEMGGESHQFHAMDFLFYAYLQSGHEVEARHLIEELKAMPPMGFDPRISTLVAFEAMYPLETHNWNQAATLPTLNGASDEDASITHWACAIGLARSGKVEEARKEVDQIESIRKQLADQKKSRSTLDAIVRDRQESKAWLEFAEGKREAAIKDMKSLAAEDSGISEASDQIPAREMLADMLLEMNRSGDAFTEYEANLQANPNRFNSLYGAAKAAQLTGNVEKANKYFAQLIKNCNGADSKRVELETAREWLANNPKVAARN